MEIKQHKLYCILGGKKKHQKLKLDQIKWKQLDNPKGEMLVNKLPRLFKYVNDLKNKTRRGKCFD